MPLLGPRAASDPSVCLCLSQTQILSARGGQLYAFSTLVTSSSKSQVSTTDFHFPSLRWHWSGLSPAEVWVQDVLRCPVIGDASRRCTRAAVSGFLQPGMDCFLPHQQL